MNELAGWFMNELAASADLGSISAASRRYLDCVSTASRRYLGRISAVSRTCGAVMVSAAASCSSDSRVFRYERRLGIGSGGRVRARVFRYERCLGIGTGSGVLSGGRDRDRVRG